MEAESPTHAGWYEADETKAETDAGSIGRRAMSKYRRDRVKVIVAGLVQCNVEL